jgi:hypothetical protein
MRMSSIHLRHSVPPPPKEDREASCKIFHPVQLSFPPLKRGILDQYSSEGGKKTKTLRYERTK